VEGDSVGDIDLDVMREREQLARSGVVLINIPLDKYSGRLLKEPEVITRGFISPKMPKQSFRLFEEGQRPG